MASDTPAKSSAASPSTPTAATTAPGPTPIATERRSHWQSSGKPGRSATEILANTTAMTAALAFADRLDAPAILAMHAVLPELPDPKIAGTWRSAQVGVGSSSYEPHTSSFVPHHHTRAGPAIDDLVCFMHRDDMPVLLQAAAIAHAQFEAIHPIADGNGRTGGRSCTAYCEESDSPVR